MHQNSDTPSRRRPYTDRNTKANKLMYVQFFFTVCDSVFVHLFGCCFFLFLFAGRVREGGVGGLPVVLEAMSREVKLRANAKARESFGPLK